MNVPKIKGSPMLCIGGFGVWRILQHGNSTLVVDLNCTVHTWFHFIRRSALIPQCAIAQLPPARTLSHYSAIEAGQTICAICGLEKWQDFKQGITGHALIESKTLSPSQNVCKCKRYWELDHPQRHHEQKLSRMHTGKQCLEGPKDIF